MLILLPPSEGKATPSRSATLSLSSLSSPSLTPAREQVLDALISLCASSPALAVQTLGIPKTQPELVAVNASLRVAPTGRADRIYTGVLYDALSLGTLSPPARRRATARVRVTSSLFGLVSPADRIPAYRLSGDAVLPGLGGVAAHWRTHLGPAARDSLGDGLLVDLRSGMYGAFFKPPAEVPVATVRVLHESGVARKVVSHFNKATKGRIVRALLESGAAPRTPAALASDLRDLGWTVELSGSQLDVVVAQL